jgi:sugar phosphate isomerase/epimerase
MPSALTDIDRLCIHTITTKPWSLETAAEKFAASGIGHVTVWRDALAACGVKRAAQVLRDNGLSVTSLCRGGFFPADTSKGRKAAIDDNLRAIDEAHAIGAPLVVLVCGAVPGLPLAEARAQITDGISALLPDCKAAGVKLAIEPLHPMYADSRSAINTMKQANDAVEHIGSPLVGVAVDVYHLWWDPDLEAEIVRCGRMNSLLAYHVCDWRTPTRHLLTDRALMGEGCIDLRQIRSWVQRAGFTGPIEVEIFSEEWWASDQDAFLTKIIEAYKGFV